MAENDEPTFDNLAPEDVLIEVMNAFHFAGDTVFASFQLSDEEKDCSRSFLLRVDAAEQVRYEEMLRIEDFLLAHASLGPDLHYVLEVGEIIHELRGEATTRTQIDDGFLAKIWAFDPRHIFVFGQDGKSHTYDGTAWNPNPAGPVPFINSIYARRPETVYAAGNAGALARLSGAAWEAIDLPFSHQINAVHESADGGIYLACEGGNCYAVVDEELIALEAPPYNFMSIAEFRGRLYWGDASYGLHVQEGNRLVPFKPLRIVASMSVSERYLVMCSRKEVFLFDGENWSGFEMGYDGAIFLRPIDMAQFS